ncbi:tyrosine-type recombinase/integrase [Janthinobacterium sp. FW305-129]|uniref:tyrosine-type recombinase/integrase n=1 Tax=Janthinobacterium sp. FW305-129 TaxID=2775054 RepID=UPI003FA5B354|nr:tyrosine-type recombinase/integrase [Janthinobacterium sp. FW305-129]
MEKALKRAGIEDFRWHDLLHTWAGWHVQNGIPLKVLQELGGWECPQRCDDMRISLLGI